MSTITTIKSAVAYYLQAWVLGDVTHYITFLVLDPVDVTETEFSDILAPRHTYKHNNDVCHRKFSGGGIRPLLKDGKLITLSQELNLGRSSEESEDRIYKYESSGRYEYTGDFGSNTAGPVDVYFWNYWDRYTVRKSTGELVREQHAGSVTHITEILYQNGRYRVRYRSASVSKTGSLGASTEQYLMDLLASRPDRFQNLTRLEFEGDPLPLKWGDFDLEDLMYIRGKNGPYLGLVEHLSASAFIAAAEEFPIECDNQIANFADFLSLMKVALDPTETMVSVLKAFNSGLGSMWMWWRYAYSTSLSDIKQAIDYQYRKSVSIWTPHRYDGWANEPIKILGTTVDVSCHCGFKTQIKPSRLYSNTQWTRGVEINPYVIWDMIPLSFVADWFLGTGDKLKLKNDLSHYLSDYSFYEMFYTTHYESVVEETTLLKADTYTRSYRGTPSILRGSYVPSGRDSSKATLIKRGIDVLSLVQII